MRMVYNASNMDWVRLYVAELRRIPNENFNSFSRGKELKYTPASVRGKRHFVTAFIRWLGTVDIQGIDQSILARYLQTIMDKKLKEPSGKSNETYNIKSFLKWMEENKHVQWRLADTVVVPPYRPTSMRKVPKITDEELYMLKNFGHTTVEKLVMHMMFSGFRVFEVTNLSWESFGRTYFHKYEGAIMENVVRKGGERWQCVVDRPTWELQKKYWTEYGKPLNGWVFPRKENPNDPVSGYFVKEIFDRARNTVFYRPEDKEIRKQLVRHCGRHIWAQRMAKENPEMLPHVAVWGGWTPDSPVFLRRYARIRDIAAEVYHSYFAKKEKEQAR